MLENMRCATVTKKIKTNIRGELLLFLNQHKQKTQTKNEPVAQQNQAFSGLFEAEGWPYRIG
jgi:hypothetical protein